MWSVLALYLVLLLFHGSGFEPLSDGWLNVVTQFLPALVCWICLPGARGRRGEVAWLAAGITGFASGNTVLIWALAHNTSLPVPSAADIGYLSFYPAVLVAVLRAARREHLFEHRAVWLDSLLGGLGAATLVSLLLAPVFRAGAGSLLSTTVSLTYPVFDLLLIVTVVAVALLRGTRMHRSWLPLISGFAVFTTADIVYDLRIAEHRYVVGTLLDALWSIGLALMSLWAAHPARPTPVDASEQPAALAVPAVATTVGLAVLVAGAVTSVTWPAIAFATLTLLATATKTQLAFRHQRRLADLRRQAATDDLTGLPNRRAFYARAADQLTRSSEAALLLLDLDKFKEVNDSVGHQCGDQLLVHVGARLSRLVPPGALLARLGGDEFALLITDGGRSGAELLAGRVRERLAHTFALGDITVAAEASIGIALAPDHGTELSELLRRADIAMYKAKRGRSGHRVYLDADDGEGDAHLRTLQDIRLALAEDQFCLHYQPKMDLATGQVRGVEALVRWDHPRRGLLYPSDFLTQMEEAGLMPALTDTVLSLALDQAAVWRAAGQPLTVAVNLSPSVLIDDAIPELVIDLLNSRQLPPSALQLEITEESLMLDRNRARQILRRLRDRGVRVSVDDFGTGYSSLAYLRELPIDELKLDRSFVFPMADDARAAALVVAIISLAHSLGLRIVAEGVEDATSIAELARHGCDEAQGYHICRPVPAAELDHWLSNRQRVQDDDVLPPQQRRAR